MASYKSRKIENSLNKKGFEVKRSHHKKYTLYIDGKRTSIYTFISHGTKEYGDTLLSKMKEQLYLSKEELEQFIDCPLEKEDYIKILAEKGKL